MNEQYKSGSFPLIKFQDTTRENPYWSSWICFCETIGKSKNISRKTIRKHFEKLIEKDDYSKKEKLQLLNYLSS